MRRLLPLGPHFEALEPRQPGDRGGDAVVEHGAGEVVAGLKQHLGELRRSRAPKGHRDPDDKLPLGSRSGTLHRARAVGDARAGLGLALSASRTSRGVVVGPPTLRTLGADLGPAVAATEVVALALACILALALRHVAGANGGLVEDAVDVTLEETACGADVCHSLAALTNGDESIVVPLVALRERPVILGVFGRLVGFSGCFVLVVVDVDVALVLVMPLVPKWSSSWGDGASVEWSSGSSS